MTKAAKKIGTILAIGPYRIKITHDAFIAWEKSIMKSAGFTNQEIHKEILRRLEICSK